MQINIEAGRFGLLGTQHHFAEPTRSRICRAHNRLRMCHTWFAAEFNKRGLPISILEAALCGLCVVCTHVGGCAELLATPPSADKDAPQSFGRLVVSLLVELAVHHLAKGAAIVILSVYVPSWVFSVFEKINVKAHGSSESDKLGALSAKAKAVIPCARSHQAEVRFTELVTRRGLLLLM